MHKSIILILKKAMVAHDFNKPCPTCTGTTKAGAQCRRTTCKFAPYCFQHTPLEIRNSNIPNAGRGLFAKRDIEAGEVVSNYTWGTRKLTKAQFDAKYAGHEVATYVWHYSKDLYYDAKDTSKSVAGLFNRVMGKQKPHVKILKNGNIRAQRRIPKGTEMLTVYGRGYRLPRQ